MPKTTNSGKTVPKSILTGRTGDAWELFRRPEFIEAAIMASAERKWGGTSEPGGEFAGCSDGLEAFALCVEGEDFRKREKAEILKDLLPYAIDGYGTPEASFYKRFTLDSTKAFAVTFGLGVIYGALLSEDAKEASEARREIGGFAKSAYRTVKWAKEKDEPMWEFLTLVISDMMRSRLGVFRNAVWNAVLNPSDRPYDRFIHSERYVAKTLLSLVATDVPAEWK